MGFYILIGQYLARETKSRYKWQKEGHTLSFVTKATWKYRRMGPAPTHSAVILIIHVHMNPSDLEHLPLRLTKWVTLWPPVPLCLLCLNIHTTCLSLNLSFSYSENKTVCGDLLRAFNVNFSYLIGFIPLVNVSGTYRLLRTLLVIICLNSYRSCGNKSTNTNFIFLYAGLILRTIPW